MGVARLSEYERKRKKAKTPEPFGGKKRGKAPIFVVQRHDARRLHYDFRLERDGALASWAVPKGIPLEPGERHLAVHVEDHPLDYASFEGEIPAGNYGAGTVEIWDEGTYELVEEKRDGGLTVRLDGKRLQGLWTLVPAKLSGDPKNWLLIKKRDDAGEKASQDVESVDASPRDLPDARDARKRGAAGAWLGVRGQVGRLPRDRHDHRRRGEADEPKRKRPHRPLLGPREADRQGGPNAERRSRRRGVRARRGWALELLGDAEGKREPRVLRLRCPLGRGGVAPRPAADPA